MMWVRPRLICQVCGANLYLVCELELPSQFLGSDVTVRPHCVVLARASFSEDSLPSGAFAGYIRTATRLYLEHFLDNADRPLGPLGWPAHPGCMTARFVAPHQSIRTGTTHVRVAPQCMLSDLAQTVGKMLYDALVREKKIPCCCEFVTPSLHMQLHPYRTDYHVWKFDERWTPHPPVPRHHPALHDLLTPLIDLDA